MTKFGLFLWINKNEIEVGPQMHTETPHSDVLIQ